MTHHGLLLGCAAGLLLLPACGSKPAEAPADETPAPAVEAQATPPQAMPAVAAPTFADLTGDPVAGKRLFIQCQACHSLVEGENRVGPSLHAVVGATAGHLENFNYSKGNKESGIVWTEETLFEYLKNPRAKVPGTTMAFAGIADPQKRADIIAFLKADGTVG